MKQRNRVVITGVGVVSPNGIGAENFAAACLRTPDGDLEDVLEYANAVAALNCRALGSRGGLPTPAEVEQLMLARPQM